MEEKNKKKTKSPFVDQKLLISQLNKFLKKFNTTYSNKADKINQLFEIKVYNDIVSFYKQENYTINVSNLFDNKFKYHLSPTGNPKNFSYFIVTKTMKKTKHSFEIHHNIPIQTSFGKELFLTPDIAVIKSESIKDQTDNRYYKGTRLFHYVPNNDLITFVEVKNYNPFPELLFSFIGLVYALQRNSITSNNSSQSPKHFSPMMVISGIGNYHTNKIKEKLMSEFEINIIFGLFYNTNQIKRKKEIAKIGTKSWSRI